MTTGGPRSVVLPAEEGDQLDETAAGLGLHLVDAPGGRWTWTRPTVVVDDGEVGACVSGCTAEGQPVPVRMIAGPAGFVAVAPEPFLADVRRIAEAADDPLLAVADVLVLLAAAWEEALEDLVDRAEELGGALGALRSSEPRAQIAQLRRQLFSIRHRLIVQARLLEPGQPLPDALPAAGRRHAARARLTFEAAASTADQTYELLGDVLTLQATTISERLTLVSVVFLPLTVLTGFFGMNFGWLVDNITTASAFWVLGVAVPCLVVLAIMLLFRRYDRADRADDTGTPGP